jgi:integrase
VKVRQLAYTENGHKKLTRKLYGVFADHNGLIRKLALFPDRKNSTEAARWVERLVSIRASGDAIPPEGSRFIENTLPMIRQKLAEWNIIEASKIAAGKSLEEHLKDWETFLKAKGNTADYIALVTSRARIIFNACSFKFWSDISAEQVQEQLAAMRAKNEGGISAQTSNFYLQAAKQFCKWMVRPARRATESPLVHLSGLNVKSDRRHDRRAFTLDEFLYLLKYLATAPIRAKMTGPERALLYRVAVETGLRRGGLARLITSSFELDRGDSAIVVKAGAKNKYKAERRVPLKGTTAELLREHLAGKMPDTPAFAVPPKDHSAKMIKADLDGAKEAWLKESATPELRAESEKTDFLRYRNSAGLYLDFHALRHTRGVWLFEHHKAHPREVQELMGVSSLALVDRYTRSFRLTDLSVIERGPDLTIAPSTKEVKNTGTDGAGAAKTLSPSLSPQARFGQISTDPVGQLPSPAQRVKSSENPAKNAGLQGDKQRRRRDSNSRDPCGPTGFQDRRNRPLCHSSGSWLCFHRAMGVDRHRNRASKTGQKCSLCRLVGWGNCINANAFLAKYAISIHFGEWEVKLRANPCQY